MVANVKGDESFPHFFHGNLGPNCVPLEGPFFEDKQEGTVVVFHEWIVLEVLNHRFKVQVLNSVFLFGFRDQPGCCVSGASNGGSEPEGLSIRPILVLAAVWQGLGAFWVVWCLHDLRKFCRGLNQ